MKHMVLSARGSRILGPDRGWLLHANPANAGDLRMLSWLPENVSTYGGDIDAILYLIYYITGAWFILTMGAIAVFLVLYRHREGRRATYVHGNSWPQSAWLLVPAVIVLGLDLWIDFRSARVWETVKGHTPAGDVRVQLTAKQ